VVFCYSISQLVISTFSTIESIFMVYTNLSDLYALSLDQKPFLASSFAQECVIKATSSLTLESQ
jgi:hypothetical protein